MAPQGAEVLVDGWSQRGFEAIRDIDGERHWCDCCVVSFPSFGASLPCDWIEISDDGYSAYLKGTEPGDVIGLAG